VQTAHITAIFCRTPTQRHR